VNLKHGGQGGDYTPYLAYNTIIVMRGAIFKSLRAEKKRILLDDPPFFVEK
jgi:hypothetical protein